MIWSDGVDLPWSDNEKRILKDYSQKNSRVTPLLHSIPVPGISGAHLRPLSNGECNGERYVFSQLKV